jgi:predicted DNA-binding transcriptional regulator AlpA
MPLPYPPPFQDLATLAEHICAGESTIENWVKQGLFPKPVLQGGKRLWRWKEVERHLVAMSEAGASSPDEQAKQITENTRAAASRSH